MSMLPCISILQPYAWLIVHGIKPVENRTWPTKFRGRILIHAGKKLSKADHELYRRVWESHLDLPYPALEEMVGGIVGSATITDCVTSHPSEYFFGPYGFVMAQARAYPQLIPYRGQLGIFAVPASVIEAPAGESCTPGVPYGTALFQSSGPSGGPNPGGNSDPDQSPVVAGPRG